MGMGNTGTAAKTYTLTPESLVNPYTMRRVLQVAAKNLLTVDSVFDAIDQAITEIDPMDREEYFADAFTIVMDAGIVTLDGVANLPWKTRHERFLTIESEMVTYTMNLCPGSQPLP